VGVAFRKGFAVMRRTCSIISDVEGFNMRDIERRDVHRVLVERENELVNGP